MTAIAEAALQWTHSFAGLGPAFYTELPPTPLAEPHLVSANAKLAGELGIDMDWLLSQEAVEAFSGNAVLAGTRPLASVYSGHQFGVWAGQLGDGRAILLGDIAGPEGRMELQL